jgi:peptide/nickel transport system permease protein
MYDETTPADLSKPHLVRFWHIFRRHQLIIVGLTIVSLMVLSAMLADVIAPYNPITPHYSDRLTPPSRNYLLGTDELGRDIFSRLLHGARISLAIGFAAQIIATAIGVMIGTLAGWCGGWIDDFLMRIADIFSMIPGLMFLIVFVTIFNPTPLTIFMALGLISWSGNARLIRGQVLAIRDTEFILAAKSLGATTTGILLRHVLPNTIAPIIALSTLGFAGAILSESILSFLGLGISIPTPSWGTMVEVSKNYMIQAWWYAIFPGLTITVTTLGFNLIGDGLRKSLGTK